ncbi:MAG: hypothetical protein KGY54_06550, partial [Oleiphilaceae bacterium]|nr:hypothetical protein [Oleiphilaceae bacterium]
GVGNKHFTDRHTSKVRSEESEDNNVYFHKAVFDQGNRPNIPPIPDVADTLYPNSTSALPTGKLKMSLLQNCFIRDTI